MAPVAQGLEAGQGLLGEADLLGEQGLGQPQPAPQSDEAVGDLQEGVVIGLLQGPAQG